MTNYDELKKAAEADQLYHIIGTEIVSNQNTTILALLAEREKLLKVVEAAYTQTPPNQMLQAALKELEK